MVKVQDNSLKIVRMYSKKTLKIYVYINHNVTLLFEAACKTKLRVSKTGNQRRRFSLSGSGGGKLTTCRCYKLSISVTYSKHDYSNNLQDRNAHRLKMTPLACFVSNGGTYRRSEKVAAAH